MSRVWPVLTASCFLFAPAALGGENALEMKARQVRATVGPAQVPFEQTNSMIGVALQPGDEAGQFNLMNLRMSPEFLDAYDIPVLQGRNLSRDISNDVGTDESEVSNVLVNELALVPLGVDKPIDALNMRFYSLDEDESTNEFIVVGVVPTQNIIGLFNEEKAWIQS